MRYAQWTNMKSREIVNWVRQHGELITDRNCGNRYRCGAILKDDMVLPCVVVADEEYRVKQALARFDETRLNPNLHKSVGYEATVRNFVSTGNRINFWDIQGLTVTQEAIPMEHLANIGGETAMGFTAFIVTMKDGRQFCFGTDYNVEFFSFPEGYCSSDIEKIVPAGRSDVFQPIHRNRPFFCLLC